MEKKYLLLLYSALLLFSCNSSNTFDSYQSLKENLITVELDIIEHENSIQLDQLVKIQKVLELELPDSISILNYDKVLVDDEIIFILDKTRTFSIYAFTNEGEYLYRISNFGEGPNEYREIRDITIDSSNSELSLLDFAGRAIWIYDINDGTLIKELPLKNEINYSSIEMKDGSLIVSHGNNCGLFDECFNISFLTNHSDSSFFKIPYNLRSFDLKANQTFSRNGQDVYYAELLNDTIYEILPEEMSISAKFAIDFGSFDLSDEFKYSKANESANDLIQYTLMNRKTIGINQFFVADSILYFNFGTPNLRHVYYNRYSGKSLSFDKFRTSNLLLVGNTFAVHKNQFVTIVSDEILMSLSKSAHSEDSVQFKETNPEMYRIVKDREMGSSLLLVFLKFEL